MPHLWPPTKADQERASALVDRTKVCSGCKTGAERDAKSAHLSEPAPTTHPSALTTAVVSSGAQSILVVPSGGPALQTLAVASNLVRGIGDQWSTHYAAATIGGNDKAPVPVVAQEPDPQPPGVAVSGGTSAEVPQDQSWVSAEPYLAALFSRYDSLTAPELGSLDRAINRHFATTRHPEISVAFKNGFNRTYVWVSKGRGGAVGDRHLRQQAATLSQLQAQITSGRASTYQLAVFRLLRHARRTKGPATVPGQGSSHRPPRLQARLAARWNISGLQWSQLRQAFGGRDSCFASRKTMRKAVAAVSRGPGRQVRTDEQGAQLVDFHSALQCVTEELWSSGQWVDRFIRDGTGSKLSHTEAFVPTPHAQHYALHSDSTADLHLRVGLDKGGRGTPTAKLVATVANQACPPIRANSILMSTMLCSRDDNDGLHEMIGPWVLELQGTLSRDVAVEGTLRAVRLIWTGDLALLSAFVGHAGASARFPSVFCPAVSGPGPLNAEIIAKFGTVQRPEAARAGLLTRRQLEMAMKAFHACDNDEITLPLSPWQHLSIVKCPLMAVYPAEVAVIPLHSTIGGTLALIDLGFEAVYETKGAAACVEAAEALGRTLLDDISVSPVPYHGGALEERECQRVSAQNPLIYDALAGYVASDKLATLRAGWADWAPIVGTLNTVADVPLEEVESFTRLARALVPLLRASFPWLRVTSKLHALAHHAPVCLWRFGALGAHGEQALEA